MFRDTSEQDRVIERPSGWRRNRRWILIGSVLAIAIMFALPGVLRMLSAGSSVSVTRLGLARVERGSFVRDIAADGKVVAAVSPTLYASSAGTVTLKVHAGDVVNKGDVLATIDSPELSSKLAQEKSALEGFGVDAERAELDAHKSKIATDENLERAQVDQKTAQREVERSQRAFSLGAYPELKVLSAEDALEKSNFALEHARKDEQVEPEQERFEVQSKRLLRDRQKLLVGDLQRQVDALTLTSPVSGQVGQVLVAERANIAKDAPLLTVIDLSALEVEMQVPESFARDLAVGMPADLSGNGGNWKGQVSAVSPEVVSGQVTARVRFDGDKPQGLRQNQRMSVRVLLDSRDNVLTVARGSFVDQDGGRFAYRVRDGIAERIPVELGPSSIDKVEVLSGLKEGDQIVVSGTDNFNNADRVVISR